ncbi:hypothetical protein GCM10009780_54840 [Actinomadura alba]
MVRAMGSGTSIVSVYSGHGPGCSIASQARALTEALAMQGSAPVWLPGQCSHPSPREESAKGSVPAFPLHCQDLGETNLT